MIIGKITFGKTIAMPGYNNDKPEIEAILEDGDTVESVLSSLNKRLIAWHKAEYPHLYQEEQKSQDVRGVMFFDSECRKTGATTFAPPPVINIQDEKNADVKGDILKAIQTAPTLEELKTYKTIASADKSKDQTIYNAYCSRLKELSV